MSKPFNQAELLARVASLARVKRYQDTIERQSAELAEWNAELEARVHAQVDELQRVNRLRRFLSPQLVDLIIDSVDGDLPGSHRREIVVVFCDLRGFTPFAESSEPEEGVMHVLAEYHTALGELIHRFEGTLERFTGDGLMVFFNDPMTVDDAAERAVTMAVAMRDRVTALAAGWHRRGHDLGLGIGIAQGFATLGRIGFEGRFDYAAIGSVTNLAARLCGAAGPWQILVAQRVFSATEGIAVGKAVGANSTFVVSAGRSGLSMSPASTNRRWGARHDDIGGRKTPHEVTTLSQLDNHARNARFRQLQDRMESVWDSMKLNLDDESVVVIPSVSVSRATAGSGSVAQAYEERLLFLLCCFASRACG